MACILGTGSSGIVSVYELDTIFILNDYEVWHKGRCVMRFDPVKDSRAALAIEDTVYQRLGFHAYILKYDGQASIAKDRFSLKLERAEGNLRGLILKCTALTEQIRLKIAIQISCDMAHIHSKNVFHCDFSCRNIGDFGGSKINNQEPLGAEEVRYELPLRGRARQARDYTKRELFALGCAINEIMAWKMPFAELTEAQTEKNYANEVFPDTNGLLVGDVIRACWNEEFETAKDVERALREQDMASPSLRWSLLGE
ncbi:putative serine-threonine protein kinase [Rhexocercosporidium sp. MPI-PUGE-AT-0058]|nr:putative serine-threonine protein kinase [Rhexocercosporidium sp. MPI-PUGE-AT-0058]